MKHCKQTISSPCSDEEWRTRHLEPPVGGERSSLMPSASKEIPPPAARSFGMTPTRLFQKGFALFSSIFLLMGGCTDFPSKHEDLDGSKIRPLTIILEPPEAAPGDTVQVRLILDKAGENPDISWTFVQDYKIDQYSNFSREARVLDLDPLMLPGGTPDSFSFVVPESTMLVNSTIPENLVLPGMEDIVPEGVTKTFLDSLAKGYDPAVNSLDAILSLLNMPRRTFNLLVDALIAPTRFHAYVTGRIEIDVTKQFTVRYSSTFETKNVNKNPKVKWIRLYEVFEKDLIDGGQIHDFKHVIYTLYSESGAAIQDTIPVLKDHSYFLVADSSDFQTYTSPAGKTHDEVLFYSWFYKNVDKTGDMDADSLISFPFHPGGPITSMVPPSDKRMVSFQFYMVVRDWRPEWGLVNSTGGGFSNGQGNFRFQVGSDRFPF